MDYQQHTDTEVRGCVKLTVDYQQHTDTEVRGCVKLTVDYQQHTDTEVRGCVKLTVDYRQHTDTEGMSSMGRLLHVSGLRSRQEQYGVGGNISYTVL